MRHLIFRSNPPSPIFYVSIKFYFSIRFGLTPPPRHWDIVSKYAIFFFFASLRARQYTHIETRHARTQWHFNVRSVFLLLFGIGNLSPTIDAEIVQQILTPIIMKARKKKWLRFGLWLFKEFTNQRITRQLWVWY